MIGANIIHSFRVYNYSEQLNAVRYIVHVLKEHEVTAVIGISPRFLLAQDNASINQHFLEHMEINVME